MKSLFAMPEQRAQRLALARLVRQLDQFGFALREQVLDDLLQPVLWKIDIQRARYNTLKILAEILDFNMVFLNA